METPKGAFSSSPSSENAKRKISQRGVITPKKQRYWYKQNQRKSRPKFVKLPAEVRVLIYKHVFSGTTWTDINAPQKKSDQQENPIRALLYVNKFIREEAVEVFFQTCTFRINHYRMHDKWRSWNRLATLTRVRHLVLSWTKPKRSKVTSKKTPYSFLAGLKNLRTLTIDLVGLQYMFVDPGDGPIDLHSNLLRKFKGRYNDLPQWIKRSIHNLPPKLQVSFQVYFFAAPFRGRIAIGGFGVIQDPLPDADFKCATILWRDKNVTEIEPFELEKWETRRKGLEWNDSSAASTDMSYSATNGIRLNGDTNGDTSPPAFPDDVPTAPLLRLSFAKLWDNDLEEVNRLLRACEDLGFFYLDLRGPGDDILADADNLFRVGENLYDLPLEEKKQYDFMHKNSYFGYKGYGANVVDKTGRTDRNEFYNVSKDDIMGLSEKLPAPKVLDTQRSLFKSFMTSAHSIITMVLSLLNDHLDLPPGTLANLHRVDHNSGDQVRLIKAPPQPMDDRQLTLGAHTDFGSVTVLFNRLGGLQVLPPGKDAEWCYVKPLPGHAIINLGDAMAVFTNGLLRSNIHRVVSPPGAQADFTRYSLVYFSRPENEVLMKRLEGSDKIPALDDEGRKEEERRKNEGILMAEDWIIRRALGHRHALNKEKAMDFDAFQGTEKLSRREGK
ncbi:hypothetical protein LTS08_003962 [Lithohypha guttulata]|nr:hypothetical protein LTS08_003962 [Lithohypha guttulata]